MDHVKVLKPIPAATRPVDTLADVLIVVADHPDVRDDARRNMGSAVRSLCKRLGEDPSCVPATAADIRKRLDGICWQKTGLSKRYISALRSQTLSALATAGVPIMRSRVVAKLDPEWAAFKAALTDLTLWCPLSHFASFCSAEGVQPRQVDEAAFVRFRNALHGHSIKGDPAARARLVRAAWTKIAKVTDGPATCEPLVTNQARRYALSLVEFPPSFGADLEAFKNARSTSNPFAKDYHKPVADSTTAMRHKQILQLASALVMSGFPIEGVTSLAILVKVENAEAALRYHYERAGSKQTPYLGQLAQLLKTIAKYWVKTASDTTERLAQLVHNLHVKKCGMVAKNRDILRQFNLDENLAALVHLGPRVLGELSQKKNLSTQDVARGVYAMAVEILVHVPIRVGNLYGLNMETELQTIRRGAVEATHLVLAKTKNGDAFEAPLAAETLRCLDLYRLAVQTAITNVPSPWLFPNKDGARRSLIPFSNGIADFVARETGLKMTTHSFRHVAVLLQRRMNPGDRETPRQLLGHRSSATTESAYTMHDTAAAAARHDALITRLRKIPPVNSKVKIGDKR